VYTDTGTKSVVSVKDESRSLPQIHSPPRPSAEKPDEFKCEIVVVATCRHQNNQLFAQLFFRESVWVAPGGGGGGGAPWGRGAFSVPFAGRLAINHCSAAVVRSAVTRTPYRYYASSLFPHELGCMSSRNTPRRPRRPCRCAHAAHAIGRPLGMDSGLNNPVNSFLRM